MLKSNGVLALAAPKSNPVAKRSAVSLLSEGAQPPGRKPMVLRGGCKAGSTHTPTHAPKHWGLIFRPGYTCLFNMKTATLRQLRHEFGSVLALVEQGEAIEITKRGKTIALLSPPPTTKATKSRSRPDFTARLKRIYGDLVVSGDVVVEERQTHAS